MRNPWYDLEHRYVKERDPVVWLSSIADMERITTDAKALWTFMQDALEKEPQLVLTDSYKAIPEHLRK